MLGSNRLCDSGREIDADQWAALLADGLADEGVTSGGSAECRVAFDPLQEQVQLFGGKLAVEAGREAWLAGRMPKKPYEAAASSPTEGLIGKTA